MELKQLPAAYVEHSPEGEGTQGPGTSDKIYSFVPALADKPLRPEAQPAPSLRRDWSAALDLVNEACEAVRVAEDRAAKAERYTQQLTQYYKEQGKTADAKIAAAEKRAEAAEARAADAEAWLVRFHDTIVEGFKGVLGTD